MLLETELPGIQYIIGIKNLFNLLGHSLGHGVRVINHIGPYSVWTREIRSLSEQACACLSEQVADTANLGGILMINREYKFTMTANALMSRLNVNPDIGRRITVFVGG